MIGKHIINQIEHNELMSDNTLHVVGVCSNPVRYHSRLRLAREAIAHLSQTKCVKLYIVESAYGDRHHELKRICEELGVEFIPLRTRTEYWIKESMMNNGFRHAIVKNNAQYLAWIDLDVEFMDPNWAQETLHQLQHFAVVQPWSDAIDMGPHGNISRHFRSFGFQHQRRQPKQKHPSQPYEYAHTGFAWACTRRFAEGMWGAGGANGPLMDWCPLGSADHHMAFAMIGEVKDTIHGKMKDSFKRLCGDWQDRAIRITNKEVGFVFGTIKHSFHGPKKRRYYRERWQLLFNYDPDKDIMRDQQGLVYIVNDHRLEIAIMHYNRSRMEDSIEEY